jgi:hypothetical protein
MGRGRGGQGERCRTTEHWSYVANAGARRRRRRRGRGEAEVVGVREKWRATATCPQSDQTCHAKHKQCTRTIVKFGSFDLGARVLHS